jgi:uncharacterized protein
MHEDAMIGRAPRLVIDTNVLLDWLVFEDPACAALDRALGRGAAHWVATPSMLEELQDVLSRSLPDRWEVARKRALTLDLRARCTGWTEAVPAALPPLRCRDRSDQMFVDLALACGAAWLLTHDRALWALRRPARARGVHIAPPSQWPGPLETARS